MKQNPLCIYHANCADGFTGAWVAREAFGDHNIDFHPGVYGQTRPNVDGRVVFLIDFSYDEGQMSCIADEAERVIILDHHKTARDAIMPLLDAGKVEGVFDMERSGAMIAWDYFFPSSPPPQLIRHVQDRDLWQFKILGTRDIAAAMFSYPYEFDVWDKMMESSMLDLMHEGVVLERKHFKDIAELVKVMERRMVIGGYSVPVVNLPYTMASDACHMLAKGQPFAASYYDGRDGRFFSLRSADDGADVSLVAKMYGGGGHAHAAGFTMPIGWEGEWVNLTRITPQGAAL